MPARIAATPDSEQIKETIGSGPFRFVKDEWQPGNQVVYVRNPDYVPRNDAPSGSTGGKKVNLDRVVWKYIPDPATAAAALEAGEVDWYEQPSIDIAVRLEGNKDIMVAIQDPRGTQGWIRPNHLQPPFNNKKARQALLYMVDQEKYLQAALGQPKYYRTCPAVFTCGGPFETAAGAVKQDLTRAKQLLKESGYDGKPVVVLDPTDIPLTHGAALVSRELMTQVGFNVDLQAMDWSTVVARRAKKEPPAQGGWNVLFTWWIASDVINPAVHAGISRAGASAWFGWPENGRIQELKVQCAGASATGGDIARIGATLGRDQPFVTQVGIWLGRIVRGDLGTSIFSGLPVATLIRQRTEATIGLTLFAMLISVGVGVPLGVLAAWKNASFIDRLVMLLAVSRAAQPLATMIRIRVASIIGVAVVSVIVFVLEGIARVTLEALGRLVSTVLQGVLLAVSGVYVLINLVVDVLYVVLDPRIRY